MLVGTCPSNELLIQQLMYHDNLHSYHDFLLQNDKFTFGSGTMLIYFIFRDCCFIRQGPKISLQEVLIFQIGKFKYRNFRRDCGRLDTRPRNPQVVLDIEGSFCLSQLSTQSLLNPSKINVLQLIDQLFPIQTQMDIFFIDSSKGKKNYFLPLGRG